MTLFKYKAKDKEGNIYERSVESKNRYDLYEIIREEGGSVVSIQEMKKFSGSIALPGFLSLGGIKTQQKITFAKNLGLMMNAGLSVTRALSVMARQSKSKKFKELLTNLEEDVSKGKTLSEALSNRGKVFSALFVSMVKAGEESGTVSKSLAIVASQMEKTYLLGKKVKGALIYPGVIICVMIAIAILMLVYMVPTLTVTFKGLGVELPLATRALIAISDFLVANTLLFFSGLVAFIMALISFFKSVLGHKFTDISSLHLPVIGEMIKEFQSARATRTLSSLLSSGVEVVVSLDVAIDVVQNHLYKDVLKEARSAIERGEPMSGVFIKNDNIFPIFVGEMIAVGEETGKISEMLMGVASYYEDSVDQSTKNLSTIIEPVLMIFIGIGVGIFAIAMLAPTYSLAEFI